MSLIFCPKCGASNAAGNLYCAACGKQIPRGDSFNQTAQVEDQPSSLLNVFSLIFPIVGLAAWLILMNSSPRRSKEAGLSALIGVFLAPLTILLMLYFLRP